MEERGEYRKRETRSHRAKYTDKRLGKQRYKWATTEKTKKEGGDKIREIKEARSRVSSHGRRKKKRGRERGRGGGRRGKGNAATEGRGAAVAEE